MLSSFQEFSVSYFESLTDIIFGNQKTRESALSRGEVKSKIYMELVTFWNELHKIINQYGAGNVPVGHNSEVDVLIHSFREKMLEIHDLYKEDVDYNQGGLIEKWNEGLGKKLIQVMTDSGELNRDLQNEFEQFWDNFTRLKGKDKESFSKSSLATEVELIASDTIAENAREILRGSQKNADFSSNLDADNRIRLEFLEGLEKPIGASLTVGNRSKIAQATANSLTNTLMHMAVEALKDNLTYEDYANLTSDQSALHGILILREFYRACDDFESLKNVFAEKLYPQEPIPVDMLDAIAHLKDLVAGKGEATTRERLSQFIQSNPLDLKEYTGFPVWMITDKTEIKNSVVDRLMGDWNLTLNWIEQLQEEVDGQVENIHKNSIIKMGSNLIFEVGACKEFNLKYTLYYSIFWNLEMLMLRNSDELFENISTRIGFDLWWELKDAFNTNLYRNFGEKVQLLAKGIPGTEKIFENFEASMRDKITLGFKQPFENFIKDGMGSGNNVQGLDQLFADNMTELTKSGGLTEVIDFVKATLINTHPSGILAEGIIGSISRSMVESLVYNTFREISAGIATPYQQEFENAVAKNYSLLKDKMNWQCNQDYFVRMMTTTVEEEVARYSYCGASVNITLSVIQDTSDMLGGSDNFTIDPVIFDNFVRARNIVQNSLIHHRAGHSYESTGLVDAIDKIVPHIKTHLKAALSEELYGSFPELAMLLEKDVHNVFDLETPEGVISLFSRHIKSVVSVKKSS